MSKTKKMTPRSLNRVARSVRAMGRNAVIRERARVMMADPAFAELCADVCAVRGSCENSTRWDTLRDTVRWCALTLGARRAVLIASQPRARHARWFERGLGTYTSRNNLRASAAFNTKLAVGALRLIALSCSRSWMMEAIRSGIEPYCALPPWLSPYHGRVLFAAALDEALAERGES